MLLAFKAFLGATVVVLMSFAAQSKNYVLVGLIPLFPTFAIIGHVIVHSEQGLEATRKTLLFGMFSILPYLAYLLAVYILIPRLSLLGSLSAGVFAWALSAGALIAVWHR